MVIDDIPANVLFLKIILERSHYEVIEIQSSGQALGRYREYHPNLILLDLHMPGRDGYEVLADLREIEPDPARLPILVFTADLSPDAKLKALKLGASDFLTKPGDANEILLRVDNFIRSQRTHQELAVLTRELEQKVSDRTRALWDAQVEIVERLSRTVGRREEGAGDHARRVGDLSTRIAAELGLSNTEIELIRLAAPLHDIGKVGLPDHILSNRAMLSDHQVLALRSHAQIGAEILSGGKSALVVMAEQIARSHHEHWDGTGYPQRLSGVGIPLAARIVAVADQYIGLINDRTGRRKMSPPSAISAIVGESGKHFDPTVVQAFMKVAASDDMMLGVA
jgi:putative two-component system response regulator